MTIFINFFLPSFLSIHNEFVYLFVGRMDVLNCYGDGFVMIDFGSIKSEEVLLMEFFFGSDLRYLL